MLQKRQRDHEEYDETTKKKSNNNNSKMHHRNKFKNKPPDFFQLAEKYPEFAKL